MTQYRSDETPPLPSGKYNVIYCVEGETILLGADKAIAETTRGESVIGVDGPTRIAETMSRRYSGQLLKISASGLIPLSVTPEHPFLCVSGSYHYVRQERQTRKNPYARMLSLAQPVWKTGSTLRPFRRHVGGDFLLIPRLQGSISCSGLDLAPFSSRYGGRNYHPFHKDGSRYQMTIPLDTRVAWLLGIYVAEGSSSGGKQVVFSLNLNKEERLAARIKDEFFRLGVKSSIQRRSEDSSLVVSVTGRSLARAFRSWFGSNAHSKHVPDWIILNTNLDVLKSFLEGYFEGDGCLWQPKRNGRRAKRTAITVSPVLALQLQLALARIGKYAMIQMRTYKKGFGRAGRLFYRIDYYEANEKIANRRHKMLDAFIAVPIRSIMKRSFSGEVYNVATEDQTYLVANVVTHNCDPPWRYHNFGSDGGKLHGAAGAHYGTMTTEQICALSVPEICQDNAILYLWATMPKLPDAVQVMAAWGFCVGKGTEILTRDLRWLPAEELRAGDSLVGFDEHVRSGNNRRYFRPAKVVSTGIEKLHCFDIDLEDGRTLRASGQHRWLMRTSQHGKESVARWIRTDDIQRHIDYHSRKQALGLPRLIPKYKPLATYEAGFLAAAFDGEGNLRQRKPLLGFAQTPNSFLTQVQEYLRTGSFSIVTDMPRVYSPVAQVRINGGSDETMRFLMQMRPPRLIDRWEAVTLEEMSVYNKHTVLIRKVRDVGPQDVVTLQTSCGTYIAEGFGAHNTHKTGAVWLKPNPRMGFWFMGQVELLLIGVKGDVPAIRTRRSNVIEADSRVHSRKPRIFRDLIERWTASIGFTKRIELFSRIKPANWDAWGSGIPEGETVLEDFSA